MTIHCNIPDGLREYVKHFEVGLFLLSEQQRPQGTVEYGKGKTARLTLSKRGQELFTLASEDFETRREVILNALALVKERPHLRACKIACQ